MRRSQPQTGLSESLREKVLPIRRTDELERVEQVCKRQGVRFEDPSFGPASTAELPRVPNLPDLSWASATAVLGPEVELFSAVAPENLLRGVLAGEYFHAAVACLAEQPSFVRRLFSHASVSPSGVYGVWVHKDGGWREVLVDDSVPVFVHSDGVRFAGTQSSRKELWPLLLEKAYAKAWGGYRALAGGSGFHTLRDLTGAPYTLFRDFGDPQLLWDRLVAARDRNWLLVASSAALSPVAFGLEREKLYCVRDLQEVTDHLGRPRQILRVADAAQTVTWSGPWARSTVEWTSKFAFLCDASDCSFWVGLEDFVRLFDTLGVFMLEAGFFADSLKLSLATCSRQTVHFTLARETDLTISLDQPDKRGLLGVEGYSLAYLRLSLAKLAADDLLFVDARLSCQKSVFVSDALPAGEYLALVEAYWTTAAAPKELTVGVYASAPVELRPLDLAACLFSKLEYYLWTDFASNNRQAFVAKAEHEAFEA